MGTPRRDFDFSGRGPYLGNETGMVQIWTETPGGRLWFDLGTTVSDGNVTAAVLGYISRQLCMLTTGTLPRSTLWRPGVSFLTSTRGCGRLV